jgi:hypothetical protein
MIYQDRLGTNARETQQQTRVFRRAAGRVRARPLRVGGGAPGLPGHAFCGRERQPRLLPRGRHLQRGPVRVRASLHERPCGGPDLLLRKRRRGAVRCGVEGLYVHAGVVRWRRHAM